MKIKVKIQRFNPEVDTKPYLKEYEVEWEKGHTVLDILNKIKWQQDGTLSFRKSCRHAICGSCAMNINGVNRLACNTQVESLNTDTLIIHPLPGYPLIKDLVVDMEIFFEKLKKVKPYLITKSLPPEKEYLQLPEQQKLFDEATNCILCSSCTSSCPTFWMNPNYLGPAALVRAFRFNIDSRDEGAEERAKIIGNELEGVFRCHTAFNCVEACPKNIDTTYDINQLQLQLLGKDIKKVKK